MRDHSENHTSNPRIARGVATLNDVIEARLSRRGFLGGLGAVSGLALSGCAATQSKDTGPSTGLSPRSAMPGFAEIERATTQTHAVPEGYATDIVIGWGDPLFEDSPRFDPANQTAAAQMRQFGYNNDFIGLVELPRDGQGRERALLCVNHEYTSTVLMLPAVAADYPSSMTEEHCATEMAAHGATIVELVLKDGIWKPVVGSGYNRRIMAANTPMDITGPAAGHPRLQTSADPTGRVVDGTMNNCAGGITPWGTYLMAEENFNGYFRGELPDDHPEAANHTRYGVPGGWYQWGRYFDRFNLTREPREPNRFGWVVEVDPMEPTSRPKKRTALGRFKHEGAESVIAPDGRLVIYMGDDQRFDYVYKFVSRDRVNRTERAANADLLDHGTLHVARFDADGTVTWMPLVFGEGPLTPANGFDSQAEVLIETRRAADLLGATPMDRPEDVEPNPRTGRAYVMLTNNSRRTEADAANPRVNNAHGHIIEIIEPDGDFAATSSSWEILVRCGNPDVAEEAAVWNPMTSDQGWFGSPDNCAVAPDGTLWVATDGNEKTGANDGIWAVGVDGEVRGTGKAFFRAPVGAEVCGPRFTASGDHLFLAVQHPGDGDGASYENPTTRWPDFADGRPPRPAVVAVRKQGGGKVYT